MSAGCTTCGRHVDAGHRCPYCGACRPLPHRLLRIVALVLSVLGLVALYLAARARAPERVRIGDITPLMGFATVTVAGHVTRAPYLGDAGDFLMFRVDDGSGELQVVARETVAETLIAANGVPAAGDGVCVSGELGLSARRGARLYLRTTNDLAVLRPPAAPP